MSAILKDKIILRFTKNFTWLFLLNNLGYLFSFVSFPILISKYGLDEVGIIFTLQALVLAIASVANYSFVYYIPTVSNRISESESFLIKLWNLVLYIRTSLSLLLAIVSSIIAYLVFPQYITLWLLSLPLLIPKILNPTLFCNAMEVNKFVFVIGFFSKLLFLVFIYFSDNSSLVNCFFAVSELITILFFIKRIHVGFTRVYMVSFAELKQFLKETFNLFWVNFFSLLKPHSILPIISYALGNQFAALFAIAEKVINVIKGISGTVFVSFFPIYNKRGIKKDLFTVKNLILILVISAISVIGVWVASPYLVYYLNNFTDNLMATKTLQILSLSIPMFFLVIPLFSYMLQHAKWNSILYFAFVQLFVLFIGLYFLIDENIIGVAKSLVLSEYAIFMCYLVFSIKQGILSKALINDEKN